MSDVIDIADGQHFTQAVLEAEVPVLVEFSAAHCAPCRAQGPILEKVARDLGGRLRVAVVDTDAMPEIANRYGVRGIPTLLLLARGEVLDMRVGLTSAQKLSAMAAPVLGPG